MVNRIKVKASLFVALVAVAAALGFLIYFFMPQSSATNTIFINGAKIEVELADTPQKRTKGLSVRESLGQNEGMLFIFEKSDYYSFWMKDMNFALDIIWIGEDKKIADIIKNAIPESYPKTFSPREPAKYVLEVNAGYADEYKIEIGNEIVF